MILQRFSDLLITEDIFKSKSKNWWKNKNRDAKVAYRKKHPWTKKKAKLADIEIVKLGEAKKYTSYPKGTQSRLNDDAMIHKSLSTSDSEHLLKVHNHLYKKDYHVTSYDIPAKTDLMNRIKKKIKSYVHMSDIHDEVDKQ